MSLDIHLRKNILPELQEWEARKAASLKEAGEMKGLIPLIEEYYEDRKPSNKEWDSLYEVNITHNLGKMAEAAGIYSHIWWPKELGIVAAKELIEPLKEGLKKLKDHPEIYKRFSAKNGWGTYDQFVPFVAEYLNACMQNPNAKIVVSR